MTHQKIFKREDGSQCRISVNIHVDYSQIHWDSLFIETKGKGKRKWVYTHDQNQNALNHVTKEEILETKLELWNKLKPTLL